jgi:cytochrome b6-f complex iron-sulfur subunit
MKYEKLPIVAAACSRRMLLQGLGIATIAALVPGCGQSGSDLPTGTTNMCGADICIDLTDPGNQRLTSPGGALLIDASNGDTIMVIRASASDVVALSAICTHAGCSMNFNSSAGSLDCPCHGSRFGEDGQVIQGPATRPVKVYAATFDMTANKITVTV